MRIPWQIEQLANQFYHKALSNMLELKAQKNINITCIMYAFQIKNKTKKKKNEYMDVLFTFHVLVFS